MRLGSMRVEWVHFIPSWKNNREIPAKEQEEEQLSIEIRRIRPIDEMADLSNADLKKWWKNRAKDWWLDDDMGEKIREASLVSLRMIYRLDRDTRNWKNFEIQSQNGEWRRLDDIIEIFFFLPNPTGQDMSDSLLIEIFNAMHDIAHATEDELKNFVSAYGGTRAGDSAPSAQEVESPQNASTQEARTE